MVVMAMKMLLLPPPCFVLLLFFTRVTALGHDATGAAGARDDILAYVKALRQQHRDNLL